MIIIQLNNQPVIYWYYVKYSKNQKKQQACTLQAYVATTMHMCQL